MKISAQILTHVADRLARKFRDACLRRDEYLARVLEVELAYLEDEVPVANSDEAQRFIKKSLLSLDEPSLKLRRPMSFQLPNELVERMDGLCESRKIVRDAFLNRLLFLLAASPQDIDDIFFEGFPNWRTEVWSEGKHEGPFFDNVLYPLEQTIDPFWPIRFGLELEAERFRKAYPSRKSVKEGTPNLYTVVLRDLKGLNIYGLNCYLPDTLIPGSRQNVAMIRELDEWLGIDSPSQPKVRRARK